MRRKVPEGMVPWSEATMTRLVEAAPEPLTSNMRVSTAMILDVVDRPGNPFESMRRLLTDNHEPRKRQLKLILEAVGIARSLLQAGILERLPEPEPDGRRYRLTVDLPPDFALNQPLSTFALAAVDVLDTEAQTYARDVVSVIEATLEDPRQILAAQLNKARGEAVAQMKADGIEYDERIELLDEVTYPKPLQEMLEYTFGGVYLRTNPWAADGKLAPEVDRARDVGAGADLPGVRQRVRLDQVGGSGVALPLRRVQGAAVRGGRHRTYRGAHRYRRVAR